MKVYKAICAVMGDLAKEGVSKDRKNTQQGYSFRGIDDMYNALAPLLSKHQLVILPRILSRDMVERINKNGTALFYVTVEAEFDLVSGEDGSKHTIKTFGEAMDSGDKGTNKAQSAAFKYAVMQAFTIPTEGDNDADGSTHEVAPKQKTSKSDPETRKLYTDLVADMRKCTQADDLGRWWKDQECVELRKKLPDSWLSTLKEEWITLGKELRAKPKADEAFPGDDDISNHPLNAG